MRRMREIVKGGKQERLDKPYVDLGRTSLRQRSEGKGRGGRREEVVLDLMMQ